MGSKRSCSENFRKFFENAREKKTGCNIFFLTSSEEKMIRSIQASSALQDSFIKENDGIAWFWARRCCASAGNITLQDFVQEARIGMLCAIRNYDFKKDFLNHVFVSAKNAVLKYLYSTKMIKISPANLSNHSKIVNKEAELGETMTYEDIEYHLNIEPEKAREAMLAAEMANVTSLDHPLKDGEGATLLDVLEDQNSDMPSKEFENSVLFGIAFEALAKFSEHEKEFFVFQFVYGFKYREAIEALGIDKTDGRKIQKKILQHLSGILGDVYAN